MADAKDPYVGIHPDRLRQMGIVPPAATAAPATPAPAPAPAPAQTPAPVTSTNVGVVRRRDEAGVGMEKRQRTDAAPAAATTTTTTTTTASVSASASASLLGPASAVYAGPQARPSVLAPDQRQFKPPPVMPDTSKVYKPQGQYPAYNPYQPYGGAYGQQQQPQYSPYGQQASVPQGHQPPRPMPGHPQAPPQQYGGYYQQPGQQQPSQQQYYGGYGGNYGGYGGYGSYQGYYAQSGQPIATDMTGGIPGKTPCNTLYVSNLAIGTREEQVTPLFSMQPGFFTANFQERPGKSPLAFIQYMDVKLATAALQNLNGWGINGKSINITYARSEMKARSKPPATSTGPAMGPGLPGMGPGAQAYGTPYQLTPISTLYISNISPQTSDFQMRAILEVLPGFSTFNYNMRPGKHPFVFAKFDTADAAGKAMNELSGKQVNGGVLKVTYAKSEMKGPGGGPPPPLSQGTPSSGTGSANMPSTLQTNGSSMSYPWNAAAYNNQAMTNASYNNQATNAR